MALTGTASDTVIENIIDRLNIPNCIRLSQSCNRPNLHYSVREKPSKQKLLSAIFKFVDEHHPNESGIIYCFSRKECEEVSRLLRDQYGLKTAHYHAKIQQAEKKSTQERWQSGDIKIIVSTVSVDTIYTKLLSKLVDRIWYGHRQGERKIRPSLHNAKEPGRVRL